MKVGLESNRFNHCDFMERLVLVLRSSLTSFNFFYIDLYLHLCIRHVPEKLSQNKKLRMLTFRWLILKIGALFPREKNHFIKQYIVKPNGGLGKRFVPIITSWEALLEKLVWVLKTAVGSGSLCSHVSFLTQQL